MVAGVFAAYLVVVTLLWWKQDALLYFPERDYVALPERSGLRHEDVRLVTADGAHIHGWFLPAGDGRGKEERSRPARASVLYFHGNGGNVSNSLFFLGELHDAGFETLAVEYHGYADSEGRPSEANLYRDADAAWEWMTKVHGVEGTRVVVWGHSLGTGVATYLAERQRPGALVLESPFTSVPDVGAAAYRWLPVHVLASSVFPNRARVARIECPVLVAHSPTDEVIPYAMGKAVFAAAREPKRFLELRGGHNDGFDATPGVWDAVDEFLVSAGMQDR